MIKQIGHIEVRKNPKNHIKYCGGCEARFNVKCKRTDIKSKKWKDELDLFCDYPLFNKSICLCKQCFVTAKSIREASAVRIAKGLELLKSTMKEEKKIEKKKKK
eukprot:gene12740-6932_t